MDIDTDMAKPEARRSTATTEGPGVGLGAVARLTAR